MARYGLGLETGEGGWWRIRQVSDTGHNYEDYPGLVIWQRAWSEAEDLGEYSWPSDMRAEYERLLGRGEFTDEAVPQMPSLVEMVDGGSGFNQACKYGSLVEGHAVYCHNPYWLYAPYKCRRTWYTGGERRDEDCPGFRANVNKAR